MCIGLFMCNDKIMDEVPTTLSSSIARSYKEKFVRKIMPPSL